MPGSGELCGYALELVVSALRGVRHVLGRLVAEDEAETLGPPIRRAASRAEAAPPRAGGAAVRSADEAAIRAVVASPPPLPAAYADDRLVLLARDPRMLFVYWDLAPGVGAPDDGAGARLVLRIEDLTLLDFAAASAWRHDDAAVERPVGSRYVPLARAAGTFRAEIGWLWPDGRFVARVRSAVIATARDAGPGHEPVRWMTVRRERGAMGRVADTPPTLAARPAPAPAGAPRATRATDERPTRRAPASEEQPPRRGV